MHLAVVMLDVSDGLYRLHHAAGCLAAAQLMQHHTSAKCELTNAHNTGATNWSSVWIQLRTQILMQKELEKGTL
jgi:hypothetical protein